MRKRNLFSDIQCPNPRDVFPADDVSFSCTATITGSVEPRFQWMTNEVLDLGSDITIPYVYIFVAIFFM